MAGHGRGDDLKALQHVSITGKDLRGVVHEPERTFLADGLGKELRRLRRKATLTQAQVARLCGMVEETVQRFETGHRRPTLQALGALARTLAPADKENAVMTKLVTLTGDSVRTGTERKRYLASNLRTRNTLVQLDRDVIRLGRLAAEHTAKGKPVPAHIAGTLEDYAKHTDALKLRLLPELPEAGSSTVTLAPASPQYGQYRPPTNQRDLLAWLKANNSTTQPRSTK